MAKPKSKRLDLNELAASIVERTTDSKNQPPAPPEKNAAAVALGRLGGLKGGKARAAKLSPTKRRQIAKRAAMSRWKKVRPK